MSYLFFGQSSHQLFGAFSEPTGRPRDAAVLLCYPLGREYLRCHWAVRQVAAQLTRAGFCVLRFDYRGTGDSAGESGSGDVASWCEDISVAAQELRDTAGSRGLALVGLRLGATLAAAASAALASGGLGELVLWDPVVSGAAYLEQLRALHDQLLASADYYAEPRADSRADELLGYRYPEAMARSIGALDLLEISSDVSRAHLIVSEQRPEYDALRRRLDAGRRLASYREIRGAPGQWDELAQTEQALMIGELPRAVVEALEQAGSR